MKRLIAICAVILVLLPLFPAPLYATVQAPSVQSIEGVHVYRNMVEEGDVFIVFQWRWAMPSDNYTQEKPASETLGYCLLDTDGTTVLQTRNPYVCPIFNTQGYNYNTGTFYFSAADNLTWGGNYTIRVYAFPTLSEPSDPINHTMTSVEYSTLTTQAANRVLMYTYWLLLCDKFEGYYDYPLKTSSDEGIVLSTYGELYFKGVTPGLATICPDLFFIQKRIPTVFTTENYTMATQTAATARLNGTDWERGFNHLGEFMGTSGSVAAALVFVIIITAICVFVVYKGWRLEFGLGVSAVIGTFGALLLGDIIFTLLMIAALVAAGGIFYLVTWKRA